MLLFIPLMLTASVASANKIDRPGPDVSRVELATRESIKLTERQNAVARERAVHARTVALSSMNAVQLMMVFPKGTARDVSGLVMAYGILPEALTNRLMLNLARLESRLAARFGLAPARVAREVDLMLELARVNLDGLDKQTVQSVVAKSKPQLGIAFQNLYVEELRALSVQANELPALEIVSKVYENLAAHLAEALSTSLKLVKRQPANEDALNWLYKQLPEEVQAPALVADPVQPRSAPVAQVINTADLRDLIDQKSCAEFMDHADPAIGAATPDANTVDQ